MTFELPKLEYAFDALEPHIDAKTMEIHHDKHHAGYVKKLNAAIENNEQSKNKSIEELISNISALPGNIQTAVRNNGGGHYNHSLFWQVIAPGKDKEPSGKLAEAIKKDFGNIDAFKNEFEDAAATRFGSGWAWLCASKGKLLVCSTPNQDNPIMDVVETQGVPILGIDVWEHAYYLKYQNRRAEYIKAFWNVVNWEAVARFYDAAEKVEMGIKYKVPA